MLLFFCLFVFWLFSLFFVLYVFCYSLFFVLYVFLFSPFFVLYVFVILYKFFFLLFSLFFVLYVCCYSLYIFVFVILFFSLYYMFLFSLFFALYVFLVSLFFVQYFCCCFFCFVLLLFPLFFVLCVSKLWLNPCLQLLKSFLMLLLYFHLLLWKKCQSLLQLCILWGHSSFPSWESARQMLICRYWRFRLHGWQERWAWLKRSLCELDLARWLCLEWRHRW